MPAIPTYTDFLLATKSHRISPTRKIINDAVKNTYFIKSMVRGTPDAKLIRGGQKIQDDIQLSSTGTFRFYNPNATFNPVDADVIRHVELGWRFAMTNYSYNDETVTLNGQADPIDQYIDYKMSKEQSAQTDMWNGMEDAIWAVPNYSTMEAGGGDEPPFYSVPVFVNEYANTVPVGWTGSSIMTLDASIETRWQNQRETYNSSIPTDGASGLLAAFDNMWEDVDFESPEDSSQYFENDNLNKMKIVTNKFGAVMFKRLQRAGNDRWTAPTEANPGQVYYNGIPIKKASTLDTAALDLNNGTAWAQTQPRFYFLNLMYLFMTFQSQNYMAPLPLKDGGIVQPLSHTQYFKTWGNLFCQSRRRQGIVYPA